MLLDEVRRRLGMRLLGLCVLAGIGGTGPGPPISPEIGQRQTRAPERRQQVAIGRAASGPGLGGCPPSRRGLGDTERPADPPRGLRVPTRFGRVLPSTRRINGSLPAAVVALTLAGCSGGDPITMPDVVGKKLDVAKSDVARAGIDEEVEVLGGGLLGVVVESNWTVCTQEPPGGAPVSGTPRLMAERLCEAGGTADTEASEESEPTESTQQTPEAEEYTYRGPKYEIVSVDEDQGPAALTQHWVVTPKLDYSTDAFKDQIKLIIADIAHNEGTDKFFAEIVTSEEIALAESPSTYENFIEERGMDYAIKEIPKKEKDGYVATYTGGYDFDLGEVSDSAFAIDWWPYAATEHEKWKPETTS